MAYGVKYFCKIAGFNGGKNYRIDLLKEGYISSSSEIIQSSKKPLTKRVRGGKTVKDDVVVGSELQFEFLVKKIDDYSDIIESNYKDWKCILYDITDFETQIWEGWLKPDMLSKIFIEDQSYFLSLVFVDGLADLKDIEYIPTTDGHVSQLTIIKECLNNTGIDLDFQIQVNSYPSQISSGSCSLALLTANTKRWKKNKDGYDYYENCYDVLSDLLKPYNAQLVQENGVYIITNHLEKDSTLHLYGWDLVSDGSLANNLVLDISSYSFRDNGNNEKIPPVKRLELTFQNKNLGEDIIPEDWTFNNEWIGTDQNTDGTYLYGDYDEGEITEPTTFTITSDSFYVAKITDNDVINFSFRVKNSNLIGANSLPLTVQYKPSSGNWTSAVVNRLVYDFETTVSISIPIEVSDNYQVRFSITPEVGVEVFVLEFFDISGVTVYDGANTISTDTLIIGDNSVSAVNKEEDVIVFGDTAQENDIAVFKYNGNNVSSWNRYDASLGYTLQELYLKSYLTNYSKFKDYVKIEIEDYNDTITFNDVMTIAGKYYKWVSYTKDYLYGTVNGDLIEIITNDVSVNLIQNTLNSVDGESTTSTKTITIDNTNVINDGIISYNYAYSSSKVNDLINNIDINLDGYYTQEQIDASFYSKDELDNGQLDSRYYTEVESDIRFAPIVHNHDDLYPRNSTYELISGNWTFTGIFNSYNATYLRDDVFFIKAGGNSITYDGLNFAIDCYLKAQSKSTFLDDVSINDTLYVDGASYFYDKITGTNASFSDINVSNIATIEDASINDAIIRTSFTSHGSNIFYDDLSSDTYVSGFTGSGFKIDKESNGDYTATFDNLYIRKRMNIYELIINQQRSIGGSFVISAANAKVKSVDTSLGSVYFRVFTESSHQFASGDIVRMYKFTGSDIRYFSGTVQGLNANSYFDLRYDTFTGDMPQPGDEVAQFGNLSNTDRQGLIYLTASDSENPYIDVLAGVNSTSFTGKTKVRLGRLDGITDTDAGLDGTQSNYFGLYSSNVHLKGHIFSQSGNIAGWAIGSTAISNSNIEISSSGRIRHTSDRWRFNDDGSFTLGNGKITGDTAGNISLSNDVNISFDTIASLTPVVYSITPAISIPSGTASSGGYSWSYTPAIYQGDGSKAMISLQVNDAEGGIYVSCNSVELGSMSAADGVTRWYYFEVDNLVAGSNTFRVYTITTDGATLITANIHQSVMATQINSTGIYTGTLTASQVTATNADFTTGSVGGWSMDANNLTAGTSTTGVQLRSTSGDRYVRVSKDSNDYVKMYYDSTSSWGIIGYNEGNVGFRFGSSNSIAGWNFDTSYLWTGTKQTSDSFSTNGITMYSGGRLRTPTLWLNESGGMGLRTNSSNGTRIEMNSTDNELIFYNSSGTEMMTINSKYGGSSVAEIKQSYNNGSGQIYTTWLTTQTFQFQQAGDTTPNEYDYGLWLGWFYTGGNTHKLNLKLNNLPTSSPGVSNTVYKDGNGYLRIV